MPNDSSTPEPAAPAADAHRSGFVTLVGRPNTGKSTLINAFVGRKVAIVTPHPQTTRTHLLGIYQHAADATSPASQVIFVDTPGAHRGRGHLSREMMRSIRAGLEGRDLTLFLADVSRPFGQEDQLALSLLRSGHSSSETPPADTDDDQPLPSAPAFLVLNKVDLLPRREDVLPILAAYRDRFPFAEAVPISARRGYNLPLLMQQILAYMPPGPEYFPPGQSTDQPEQFLVAEIIREQAMLVTRAEVPHTLAVRVESDSVRETPKGPLRSIQAALYCERPGQKAILIGHGGETIRRIGTEARQLLESALNTHIFLDLHVLVRNEWRQDPRMVASFDYHHER